MKTKNPLKGIERRDFLKILSLTGVGSLVYSKDMIASVLSPAALSRVVIITDDTATDTALQKPKATVVKTMIDEGIKTFTGLNDVGEAWKSIFPGITAQKVIALKVNTLFNNTNCGTHPEVAYAVADGLVQMDFSGTKFPANNIIIFDYTSNYLTTQGYTLNNTASGVRCFATSTNSTESYTAATISVKLSTIVTQTADYLVNIAMLKNHSDAGVSLCLKNHFGTVDNAGTCHAILKDIGALSALTPIKNKQKFCIIDAIYAITSGGPATAANKNPNKIIMGQDIVAVDYTGRSLLSSLGLSSSDYNTASYYIDSAATKYSLGTNDPNNIETLNITTPVTGTDSAEKPTEIFQNSPNPFTNETNIQFYLMSNEYVELSILNYYGQILNRLINKKLDQGMHTFTWNGLGSSGEDVPAGFYICELKTKSYNKSIIIQKVK